jgi:TonB family protein
LKKIFIQSEGKALGPSSVEEVRSLITAGWLSKSNLAQYEDDEKWQPLSDMPEFSDAPPASPASLASSLEPALEPELPELPELRPELRVRRNFAPFLHVAFRVLLLLILLGLVAWGGFYLMRHGKSFIKSAAAFLPSRSSAATNTPSATNIASSKAIVPVPATNAVPAPAQKVRVVQLVAAPINTAPAPWERATPPASNAPPAAAIASVSNAATLAPSTVVSHRTIVSNIDPQATPFGAYDVTVINAVQKRWFTLVDQNPGLRKRTGRVVVSFLLFKDGSVENVKLRESSGDAMEEFLCQQAVNDSKPFPRWPVNVAGENASREMQFTFQY